MSGSGGTPGPAHVPYDTSNISGDPDGADVGTSKSTASKASNAETGGTQGGSRVEPGPSPATSVDTSGTNSPNGGSFSPTPTTMRGTVDTQQPGQIGQGANPAYRAPSGPVAGSSRDTTLTDVQPGGSVTNPVPSSLGISNLETANIGAAGSGTGALPATPGAAPTVATGPRYVTVTWVAVADPANDPVREYIIENDRGGRWVAGRNATSKRIDYIDPSQIYKFRVAARNRGGIGAFSAFSAPIRSYNPDATDALKPAGLNVDSLAAGIYQIDGTLKPGTGGTNNAPVLGAVTAGAAASKTVTVNWVAPTVGLAPTSYVIKASNGQTFISAAGTTSRACVFTAAGPSVTFTVQAINARGAGSTSVASAAVTVP